MHSRIYAPALIVVLLFFVVEISFAQNKPSEFGEVSMDELRATSCSFDSTANAVILFDVIHFDPILKYERHVRIKFFKNPPLEWANLNIVYLKRTSRLAKVKAATYNLKNGAIETAVVSHDNFLETKVVNGISRVSIPLEKVMPGSVVEYTCTIYTTVGAPSRYWFSSGHDRSWVFQEDIPCYWAEYNYHGPLHSYVVQGSIPVAYSETKRSIQLIATNVPAYHAEPNSPPKSSLVGTVFLTQALTTWKNIGLGALRFYGYGYDGDSLYLNQLARPFMKMPNDKAKVDSVVAFVKKKVRWNGDVDPSPDRSFAKAFDSKLASSAEINLIIASILRKSGFGCYPCLISTQDHGPIDIERPDANQFNDLIAAAVFPGKDGKPEEIVLLDGTDPYLRNDVIPMRCLNGKGWLLRNMNFEFIPIVAQRSRATTDVTLRFDETNSDFEGDVSLSFSGLYAGEQRKAYFSDGSADYDQRISRLCPSRATTVEVVNAKETSKPFKVSFKVRDAGLLTKNGDLIYVTPFIIVPPAVIQLTASTRLYPIDFNAPMEQIYTARIELPSSYTADELPKPATFSLPNKAAQVFYSASQQDNVVNLTYRMVLNRVLFEAVDYPALREFQNQILAKQAETIVLKKK